VTRATIPAAPTPADEILADLERHRDQDVDWRGGRVFSLVYHAGEAHERLLQRAHALYASANLLNPMAFGGLRALEQDLIEMTASLLHGPARTVGCVTSGGTESILLAVQTLRDRARRERPWIRTPELVCARTAHPAFDKAAHYFGVKLVKTAVGPDLRADVDAMARKIGRRTIGLVGSAPQYAHGVVDPIPELGALARGRGLPLHVDACVGGFVLPWLERLGRPLRPWDFRVEGVTSISADLHKYGYAGKGASVLLWRSMDLMRHQFFIATDSPGGVYASPTLLGTRPGGPIAAAWAALRGLGETGYLALTREALWAWERLREGIEDTDGLEVLGDPDATILAYRAQRGGPDVYAVADRLAARGWVPDRQQKPPSLHLTVTANHAPIVDAYLRDLRASVVEVKGDRSLRRSGTAPMYGMIAKMPLRGFISHSVRHVLKDLYGVTHGPKEQSLFQRLIGQVIKSLPGRRNDHLPDQPAGSIGVLDAVSDPQ
jgi:glutamate/tyrosine decarboxylase-like PLP-dependent enzyme